MLWVQHPGLKDGEGHVHLSTRYVLLTYHSSRYSVQTSTLLQVAGPCEAHVAAHEESESDQQSEARRPRYQGERSSAFCNWQMTNMAYSCALLIGL